MHKVYCSESLDPYFNLAFEDYLVQQANQKDQILFLWQNQNTVVIGINQNPWKECNLMKLYSVEGMLVRRRSGGGAVFHDKGNLNFTLISAFTEDKVHENIGLIIKTLKNNGIEASFSGKNDIVANGYKISGNAFYTDNDILCHHGTLLVDVDFEKLGAILTVSDKKLQSKGIDSVKSRVANLKALNKELTIEALKLDLIAKFLTDGVESSSETVKASTDGQLVQLMEKYKSWEWNFGASPEFDIQISERHEVGEIDVYINVKDGLIFEVKVYTDAIDLNMPKIIEEKLKNEVFDEASVRALIRSIGGACKVAF